MCTPQALPRSSYVCALDQPGRALDVVLDQLEKPCEVWALRVHVERVSVVVGLVEVKSVRVLLVENQLESLRARLVGGGVATVLERGGDEVLPTLGRDIEWTAMWYMAVPLG